MGKLVVVVGNVGVGKTSLTCRLSESGNFITGLELNEERPFQRLLKLDCQRYALANQIDYLLLRADQERIIRRSPNDGVQDGGLDMDFYIFTRLFLQKGYLNNDEFDLCEKMYGFLRELLPPPELIIRMKCPHRIIRERFVKRGRGLEIAQLEDLDTIENLVEEWMAKLTSIPVLEVDASEDDPEYLSISDALVVQIRSYLDSNRQ